MYAQHSHQRARDVEPRHVCCIDWEPDAMPRAVIFCNRGTTTRPRPNIAVMGPVVLRALLGLWLALIHISTTLSSNRESNKHFAKAKALMGQGVHRSSKRRAQ